MFEIDYVYQDSQEASYITEPGTYDVKVVGTKSDMTKNGDPFIQLFLETADGRQMTSTIVLNPPDLNNPDKPKKMDFVLRALGLTEGVNRGSKVKLRPEYFIGRKATVDVELGKETANGKRYSEVRRWRKFEGNNVSESPQASKPGPVDDPWGN
jgi:hypothetical protein